MKKNQVGSLSNEMFDLQIDLLTKLKSGSITVPEFKLFLQRKDPFAITDIRQEWQEFYRKYFRMTVDFTDVAIPESQDDFSRVIFIPQGLTYADIVKVLKKKFKVRFYTENLDKDIKDDVRTSNTSYAIRLRDRIEADEEFKNLSANQIKEKGINVITLMERLILELKYWDETGEHLDISNVTLCAGSRRFGGGVPGVDWRDGRLFVGWCDPDVADDFLRARVAVS